MFQTKDVEKIRTHVSFQYVFFNCALYEIMWKKILYSRAGQRRKFSACALHAGDLWLWAWSQNM